MFHKQEQPILTLVSGSNSLTKQRLNSLSKDMHDLKESLEFSQHEYYDKFQNMGNKVQKNGRRNISKEGRATRYPHNKTIIGD